MNCRSGDTLAEEQGNGGVQGREACVPLEQATTSSLQALQAYSLGEKALNEKGPAVALPYHQRAIKLDPNFAMGYEAVGSDYFSLGELGRASEGRRRHALSRLTGNVEVRPSRSQMTGKLMDLT